MRQSLLYFIAAALFAVATGLNFFNDGLNLMTGIGLVMFGVLVALGMKSRRSGA
jgi:hypothetical protein